MTEPHSLSGIWKQCVAALGSTLPKQHVETWIKPMKPQHLDESRLTIEVPSPFFKDWVAQHHQPLIESTLEHLLGHKVHLELLATPIRNDGLSPIFHQPPQSAAAITISPEDQPKYTFENFIVGPSNRFAHAASMAVSEAPGRSYNPLFIYGGAGLGKTHLLRAVGHLVMSRTPGTKVLYLTCEAFMNEMIASIRGGHEKMVEFRRKFRRADVLLIDDIQFLEGKESTQEEFFHTFNELYESNKQIVASSDSHPKDIHLEERLKSRFEMGLIADIQAPDFETRMAILTKKAEQDRMEVPEEILRYIAVHAAANIRQLEGSLVRLIAISTLTGRPLSKELAEEVVTSLLGQAPSTTVTLDAIRKTVADYFHFQPMELVSKKRTKDLTYARHLMVYLARELTKCSLPEIGRYLGGRDHTTILHANDVIKSKLSTDPSTTKHVQDLLRQLTPEK